MTRTRSAAPLYLSLGLLAGAGFAALGFSPAVTAIAAVASIAAEVFRAGGDR